MKLQIYWWSDRRTQTKMLPYDLTSMPYCENSLLIDKDSTSTQLSNNQKLQIVISLYRTIFELPVKFSIRVKSQLTSNKSSTQERTQAYNFIDQGCFHRVRVAQSEILAFFFDLLSLIEIESIARKMPKFQTQTSKILSIIWMNAEWSLCF